MKIFTKIEFKCRVHYTFISQYDIEHTNCSGRFFVIPAALFFFILLQKSGCCKHGLLFQTHNNRMITSTYRKCACYSFYDLLELFLASVNRNQKNKEIK